MKQEEILCHACTEETNNFCAKCEARLTRAELEENGLFSSSEHPLCATCRRVAIAERWRQFPEGKKFDDGKLRLDLITPEMIRSLGEVLTYGAKKYGDRNWEKGIDEDRLYAACERHLLAYREGQMLDEESGLPHLYHAFCTLGMWATLDKRKENHRTKFQTMFDEAFGFTPAK